MVLPVVLAPLLVEALTFTRPRVEIRQGDLTSDRSTLRSVAVLSAEGISNEDSEQFVLADALGRDLLSHFSPRNRQENSLITALAEDDEDESIVGVCGIEVVRLTPSALDAQRASESDIFTLEERPLLTNLAVNKAYRRQGIAKRLCKEAETLARSWGYSEVLLKVEKDNSKARKLYRGLGYRDVAVDREAERPDASSGRLKFVQTTQIAMRKDLRYPPLDTVAGAVALLVALAELYPSWAPLAAEVVADVAAGRAEEVMQKLAALLPALAAAASSALPGGR